MNGLPKYMLLTHPTMKGQEFIIRTQEPLIIGQVVKGNVEDLIREFQPIGYGKAYEQNEWAVFYAGMLAPYEWKGTTQEQADELARIMRKMSDFYLHLKK